MLTPDEEHLQNASMSFQQREERGKHSLQHVNYS